MHGVVKHLLLVTFVTTEKFEIQVSTSCRFSDRKGIQRLKPARQCRRYGYWGRRGYL